MTTPPSGSSMVPPSGIRHLTTSHRHPVIHLYRFRTAIGISGNDGPFPFSVVNSAPWIFTIGASTIDRDFQSTVVLRNGQTFQGSVISFSKLNRSRLWPLVFAGDIPVSPSSRVEARSARPPARFSVGPTARPSVRPTACPPVCPHRPSVRRPHRPPLSLVSPARPRRPTALLSCSPAVCSHRPPAPTARLPLPALPPLSPSALCPSPALCLARPFTHFLPAPF
ncbi:CO(2)-response secreted protease [Nymphaea thermarum]|nr:CO(2)-response secreted protease [Nymphaea thermarum]